MRVKQILVCMLIIITINKCQEEARKEKLYTPKIAIIGGGFSGITLSHYLNKKFNDPNLLNITIFEKQNSFGGRIKSEKIDNRITELGVNVNFVYDWFLNVKELLREYNINYSQFDLFKQLAIFDGEVEFQLSSKTNETISLFKEKYNKDFVLLIQILKKFQTDFQNIYDIVKAKPQISLINLLNESKLDPVLLERRVDHFFANLNMNKTFIDEFVNTFLFSYNNKNTDMHIYGGLRTLFNYFTAKFTVKEGLISLLKEIIYNKKYYNKNTFLKLESNVFKIEFLEEENKYIVFYKFRKPSGEEKIYEEKFDKIVISHLLKSDEIKFINFSINSKNIVNNTKISNMKSYFVIGNLKNEKKNNSDNQPDIMLINDSKGFNKINQIIVMCKDCYNNRNYDKTKKRKNSLYKIISSQESLSKQEIQKYFLEGVIIKSEYNMKDCVVKPDVFDNAENIPDIVLHGNGLFYNNLEYLNNNLEYAAISSQNIAGLIYNEYNKIPDYLGIDF